MITTHSVSAAQMGVPFFPSLSRFFPFFAVTHNLGIRSPLVWAHPILRPAIVPIVVHLELAGDGLVTVPGWTVLDLFFG